MSKKKIIALAMSAVMAVGMIAGCGSTNNSGTDTAQTESTEKVTPTFMYFVANADDNFDATNTMYTELENEYKDKINFQLVNVDENDFFRSETRIAVFYSSKIGRTFVTNLFDLIGPNRAKNCEKISTEKGTLESKEPLSHTVLRICTLLSAFSRLFLVFSFFS